MDHKVHLACSHLNLAACDMATHVHTDYLFKDKKGFPKQKTTSPKFIH